jgi:DNA repair protein RAD57
MEQIAQSRLAADVSTHGSTAIDTRIFLDNVHTMHVTEVDGLEHALAYMVPNVIDVSARSADLNGNAKSSRLPISLIVIDSIGALFRSSYDSNQGGLPQRSRMLCVLADRLKYLAHKYNIAVVVINQVSDVFRNPSFPDTSSRISRPNSPALTSDAGRESPVPDSVQPTMTYKVQSQYFSGQTKTLWKEASLGLVWANAVNVRIMLSRTGRRRPLDSQDLTRRIKRPRTIDGRYRQGLEEEERIAGNAARNTPILPSAGPSSDQSWEATLIRRMHLVFSPFAKQECLDYVIMQSGIHSLPPGERGGNTDNESRTITGGPTGQPGVRATDDNEFQDEVFDDLGNLPVDFWSSEAFEQMQAEALKDGAKG